MDIINELEKIIGYLKAGDVTEFEYEHKDIGRIKMTRGSKQIVATQLAAQPVVSVEPAVVVPQVTVAAAPGTVVTASAAAPVIDSKFTKIESPLVGTFYRKPAPDSAPFVQEGQSVRKGDTLCIVEAMKLMNEIESTCDGIVEKVLVSDGQVVEYGEVLFLIKPA